MMQRTREEEGRAGLGVDARPELAALKQTLSRNKREVHQTVWRRAVQARTTIIVRVLRVGQRAVRGPSVRVREALGWLICTGTDASKPTPVMRVVTRAGAHSLADLAAPIAVVVVHRKHVNVDVLNGLGALITLVFTEVG
jgi:hypothetical protein